MLKQMLRQKEFIIKKKNKKEIIELQTKILFKNFKILKFLNNIFDYLVIYYKKNNIEKESLETQMSNFKISDYLINLENFINKNPYSINELIPKKVRCFKFKLYLQKVDEIKFSLRKIKSLKFTKLHIMSLRDEYEVNLSIENLEQNNIIQENVTNAYAFSYKKFSIIHHYINYINYEFINIMINSNNNNMIKNNNKINLYFLNFNKIQEKINNTNNFFLYYDNTYFQFFFDFIIIDTNFNYHKKYLEIEYVFKENAEYRYTANGEYSICVKSAQDFIKTNETFN
jgi:hypothetical protein